MMEIKFKGWLKKENKIVEVKSLHLGTRKIIYGYSETPQRYGNKSCSLEDVELMQYIGIHDVDNNEIYDGDVVVRTSDRSKYVVKWFSKYARFALSTNNEPDQLPMIMFLLENTRVIGNVYQNPELLEGMESNYPRVGVDEE